MVESAGQDNARAAILIVDDDADIRLSLEMLLQYEGFEVWTAKDGEEALGRLEQERARGRTPALIVSDLKMPRMDGMALLEAVVALPEAPPLIVISGHGDVATAVDAIRRGANNFLEKPLDENRVLVTIRTTLRHRELKSENKGLRKQLRSQWPLVGESELMRKLGERVQQVAAADASVLITGENGSGKEVVARNLHLSSARAAGPFVTVNCAAIPHELIESELFGHEKGSFTGANERRTGHFEAADGGTLFLDEIGDMPLPAQAKVLRALETHEVVRVGDSHTIPVDIRVVAATNADLTEAVEAKSFRLDLFYRLNVVPLRVPALRERADDIPLLVEHFLLAMGQRSGRGPQAIEPAAVGWLRGLEWIGNVRQLRNLLEGASVFSGTGPITLENVQEVMASGPAMSSAASVDFGGAADPFEAPTFEEFKQASEMLFFKMRLERNEGNVKRTAEELGMQRSHLYKKLDRYGLR
ncbi:MAG: two-component system nitrogen regulation response regulator NtrX [Planctomycetota bacterium]|jgi:two-component system nitrogen regulation response regulator NtrX